MKFNGSLLAVRDAQECSSQLHVVLHSHEKSRHS